MKKNNGKCLSCSEIYRAIEFSIVPDKNKFGEFIGFCIC